MLSGAQLHIYIHMLVHVYIYIYHLSVYALDMKLLTESRAIRKAGVAILSSLKVMTL